jgi:hypothetical protein
MGEIDVSVGDYRANTATLCGISHGPVTLLALRLEHILWFALSKEYSANSSIWACLPEEDDVAGPDLITKSRHGPCDLGIWVVQAVGQSILLRIAVEEPKRHQNFTVIGGD